MARSNGATFEEALAVIGAGKTIELELAFQDPGAAGDADLEWPGGVRFAAGQRPRGPSESTVEA